MMEEMQLIMIVLFILMAYSSVTTARQPHPQARYSVAKPLQASCLPKDGDIGHRTVSSVLQCQQFCTATRGCNTFAIGEVSGSTTCKMYSNIQPTSNCLEDGSWVGYSLTTKTDETKLVVTNENICRTNDAISFLFPRMSTNDYARIATASAADLSSFTVAFWTKVTQQGSGGSVLFSYQAYSSVFCSDIEIKVNVIGFVIKINNERINVFASIPGNSLTHVAVTWSSMTKRLHLYLNGTLRITHNFPDALLAIKSGGNAYLGVTFKRLTSDSLCLSDGSLTFKGKLSQVYMWKKELTAIAIAAAMNSKAECQDLVFGWKDFSGNSYGMVRTVP